MEKSPTDKSALRNRIKQLRAKILPEEKALWDRMLCSRFLELADRSGLLDGRPIYLYMDIRNEAGTWEIFRALKERNIPAAFPRTIGKSLVFSLAAGKEEMEKGAMGIWEPKAFLPPVKEETSLVVVPGVAFDTKGRRLGYGGGYYDRFFSFFPDHVKWGLAYDLQMEEELQTEPWDQQMDAVITPGRIFFRESGEEKGGCI